MAVEAARGCGFRQVGGIYLVSGGVMRPCGRFPIPLTVCPACGGGIKPARGWTWINPPSLFSDLDGCGGVYEAGRNLTCDGACPMRDPDHFGKRAGLLWIGEAHYKTPAEFARESATMGVSRRIKSVPRDFKVGEHWVFVAHRKAIDLTLDRFSLESDGESEQQFAPGIFSAFLPERVEIVVTESQSNDELFMRKLEKRGLTPVVVPDDDPDHNRKGKSSTEISRDLGLDRGGNDNA